MSHDCQCQDTSHYSFNMMLCYHCLCTYVICFVTGKYKYTDSVSEILQSQGWPTSEARRKEQRLVNF